MKKVSFILAAAAVMFGMNACTEDDVINDIVNGNDEGTEMPLPTIRVKSASDLANTTWQYAMDDMQLADEDGNVIDVLDFSNYPFVLTFDNDYAQLAFPEDMVMLTGSIDADGAYTMEEVAEMHFAYSYELSTTSGTLTAMDNDITGQPIDLEIPFTYDAAADAIIVQLADCLGADPDNSANIELTFSRAE